jgi:hypothetical protein
MVFIPLHPENLCPQARDGWKVKKENFLNTPLFGADVTGFIVQPIFYEIQGIELFAYALSGRNYPFAGSGLLLCRLTDSDGQVLLRVSATDG